MASFCRKLARNIINASPGEQLCLWIRVECKKHTNTKTVSTTVTVTATATYIYINCHSYSYSYSKRSRPIYRRSSLVLSERKLNYLFWVLNEVTLPRSAHHLSYFYSRLSDKPDQAHTHTSPHSHMLTLSLCMCVWVRMWSVFSSVRFASSWNSPGHCDWRLRQTASVKYCIISSHPRVSNVPQCHHHHHQVRLGQAHHML